LPSPHAAITVTRAGGGSSSDTTDPAGHYQVGSLGPGSYTVSIWLLRTLSLGDLGSLPNAVRDSPGQMPQEATILHQPIGLTGERISGGACSPATSA
ncbi:MAG: carboxypeptidase-like regulatory domain-containing protein, partial [Chloroflexi bacterium]|nr:carboxypeptidase-like regulatory domain-containing protein [Chloroflexota bacterium]